MPARESFTGIKRRRKTRKSVLVMDRVAKALITIGGLGTILAVATVCFFLIYVVAPLFGGGSVKEADDLGLPRGEASILKVGFDEYRVLGWTLDSAGILRSFRMDNSEVLTEAPLVAESRPSAVNFSPSTGEFVAGLEDGRFVLGRVDFKTSYIKVENLPKEVLDLKIGELSAFDNGIIERSSEDQFRLQKLELTREGILKSGSKSALKLLDFSRLNERESVVTVLDSEDSLFLCRLRLEEDMMTFEEVLSSKSEALSYERQKTSPQFLRTTARGDCLILAWEDGQTLRFDCRLTGKGQVAENMDLTEGDRKLVKFDTMIGHETFIACDDQGDIGLWFKARPEGLSTSDNSTLVKARSMPGVGVSATATASSRRSRIIAVGYADGSLRAFQTTTGYQIVEIPGNNDGPAEAVALGPKEDSIAMAQKTALHAWDLDVGHPEATIGALFGKVWYEGYAEPAHVWQSSAGSDSAEPKLGLIPLIFGSMKATFYSLLFGVPLALLAAIFTSEFMSPKTKSRVKPTVELMASLPSVVLGFLAALVVAPFVEDRIPALLSAIVTLPAVFLFGAQVWQALPQRMTLRYPGMRFLVLILLFPIGIQLASWLGPAVEIWLFSGDIKVWLNGGVGDGTGGWVLLLLPLSLIACSVFMTRILDPLVRRRHLIKNRRGAVLYSALKTLGGFFLVVLFAYAIARILTAMGIDSRGGLLDTYVARNALVVGFIMGFAIIPIIYTIAEDALSTVPEHLRAASLGAGATQWQTAVRIIIPTATSGLFSAVMIGLGRAVGETMIVLMAAGNTPIMEWNVFNGFRTLSANIAVELPEAVRDSTHYRTLFLAALVLFILTFILNTCAEIVRERFRKRAYQL